MPKQRISNFYWVLQFAAAILAFAFTSANASSSSVAILIGFQNYHNSGGAYGPLPYTVHDLLSVRRSLLDIGFDEEKIIIYSDVDVPQSLDPYDEVEFSILESPDAELIVDKIKDFALGKPFQNNDVFLVYMTGHGGIYKNTRVFALPSTRPDRIRTFVAVNDVISEMSQIDNNAHPLLIIDTCANPLREGARAPVIIEQHVLDTVNRIFSSDLGEVSRFDESLSDSVFTHYLSDSLLKHHENSREVLTDVQKRVPRHPIPSLSLEQREMLPNSLVDALTSQTQQTPQGHMRTNFNIGTKSSRYETKCLDQFKNNKTGEEATEELIECLQRGVTVK